MLGTHLPRHKSQAGMASGGQGNPETRRIGSDVNATTKMDISRLLKKRETARPRKIVAKRNGTMKIIKSNGWPRRAKRNTQGTTWNK